MADIIEILKSMPDYIGSNGRCEEEIAKAENALGVSFAEDYRTYLKEIGLVCYDGHELTGLTKSDCLGAVSVTKEQRERVGEAASSWYVVEETGIDGIVIWQAPTGEVYQTGPGSSYHKLCNSLSEFILGIF